MTVKQQDTKWKMNKMEIKWKHSNKDNEIMDKCRKYLHARAAE